MNSVRKLILVNGIGLSGGGQVIIKQFCKAVTGNSNNYIIFYNSELASAKNITVVKVDNINTYIKRMFFSAFGMHFWLKKRKLKPNLYISFINHGAYLNKEIPQLVYYHQPVPISKFKWSFFKKSERNLWFYKNIYPKIVSLFFNKRTVFVVQTEWINKGVEQLYKIKRENIYTIKPNFEKFDKRNLPKIALECNKFYFFYPSGYTLYKNHMEIVNAIDYLYNNSNTDLLTNLCIIFTLDEDSLIGEKVSQLGLSNFFKFVGNIPFNEVLAYYELSEALLFPSKIESFGLPLLEATSFGLKIICIDSEYSREVVKDYKGVNFLPCDSPSLWAQEILNSLSHRVVCPPQKPNYNSSWSDFIRLTEKISL